MVEECAADHEGVGKVETGHGGKLIHGLAVDPDTLGVILTDGIEEMVGLGEETGWHAWVHAKGCEGEEVAEGHGAADKGESVCIGSFVIVPGDEALGGKGWVSLLLSSRMS